MRRLVLFSLAILGLLLPLALLNQSQAASTTYKVLLPHVAAAIPTPTPVPTATSTPIPTPTPQPGWYISSSRFYKPSYSSYSHIVGELWNNRPDSAYNVEVLVTFYNAAGQVAGSDSTYTMYEWLSPGMKAPFDIMAQPSSDWTRYELQLSWYNSWTSSYNHDFAILNTNAYWSGSYYHVVGELKNNTGDYWRFVKAIVTLYDGRNKVVDADYSYAQSSDLGPGWKTSFDVSFSGSHLQGISRFGIGAEGWK